MAMVEPSGPSQPHAAGSDSIVVLLFPEAMEGFDDIDLLGRTLIDPSRSIRVLLCLSLDHDGDAFATMLDKLGVETQILLGPGVNAPGTRAFALPAPPDISEKDLKEFALALSDVVLMTPVSGQSSSAKERLAEAMGELKKLTVAPGARVPDIPKIISATRDLDPDVRGWHAWGRCSSGRLEQLLIEALAYNWSKPEEGSIAESRKRLRKCVGKWRPGSYFAPDPWQNLAPDPLALNESSAIVARYNALDRSAV